MSLSDTITRLRRMKKAVSRSTGQPARSGRLSELASPSINPGNLRGRFYVPEQLAPNAPLVVVLHGCTQDAAGYDQGSGWSRLADRRGFALLFPEQNRSNNPNLCFNWYNPEDTQRGGGEAASIQAMVEAMIAAHGIDRGRIFVTGLSAGGAMASVMLATYPEVFSAGAIVAGLPYGCATSLPEAFGCMAGRAPSDPALLASRVRGASGHRGRWPRVSVWQGSADQIVAATNADAIVAQWTRLHGLPTQPSRTETVDGYPRSVWTGPTGAVLVEHYAITGMGHGTPLMPGTEEGQSGEAMAHMLDVQISSTDRIAEFFGLTEASETRSAPRRPAASEPPRAARPEPKPEPVNQVQKTIEDALKAAGLMR
jgi:poly(hydroxyalkanoate) depolymerase family esterase